MRKDVIEIITYLEGAKQTAKKPGITELLEPEQSDALQGGFDALLAFFEGFLGTLPLPAPPKGLKAPKRRISRRRIEMDGPMAEQGSIYTTRRHIELD